MIPKDIYIYWNTIKQPDLVKMCINSIKKHCPDYNIHILNDNTYKNYIKRKEPESLKKYKIQKKSNWIRTVLIANNGGIWMDASIMLTENINNWLDLSKQFIGIKNNKRIENWFFASQKNNILMKKWLQEYERALDMGADKYQDEVGKLNNWDNNLYLFHQLCFLNSCRLLKIDLYNNNNIDIFDVSDLGYPPSINFINWNYNYKKWERGFVLNILMLNKSNQKVLPLYKFVGFTRNCFFFVKNTKIEKNSPLDLAGYSNNKSITFHNELLNFDIVIYILLRDIFSNIL